ncbi:MAG: sigma-70 family RNA polymerase sigma factor [Raineya sp.]
MEKEKTFLLESELVSQLQQKDSKAFAYLYDHYAPSLYGVICRIVASEEVAQDILQDVFLKIWGNISQYSSSKGRLFTWLLNIARNTAIDKLRSKDFRNEKQSDSLANKQVQNKIDDTPKANEFIGLADVMNKLREEHRCIIDMMYFEGYTQAEIAEKMNIPLGTVKTRARAALEHLRSLLKEDYENM